MATTQAHRSAKIVIFGLSLMGAVTVSCASMMHGKARNMSARFLGCASKDIVISDMSSIGDTRSWVATCRGKTMVCSSLGGDDYGGQIAGHSLHMHKAATVECKDASAAPDPRAEP